MTHQPLIHRFATREEWLAARGLGIGASELAGVMGQSKRTTPWKVWAEKVAGRSLDDDIEDNEAAMWGLEFERPIARRFGKRFHRIVKLPPKGKWELYVHPERSWMRATPDAWQWPRPDETHLPDGEPGVLQVKTADRSVFHRDWEDGPPLHHEMQVQWEMAVTGCAWGSLIVLVGGNRLAGPFDMLRSDAFIDTVVPYVHRFWRSVETQTEPPLDGSLITARAVARLYSREGDGEVATLDEAADKAARELVEVKAAIKALEERESLLKATLISQLKSASVGLLPGGGQMTYQTVNKRSYTVKSHSYRTLRGP